MKRFFRDVYGCTASIRYLRGSGAWMLTVCDGYGARIHRKGYGTERGARIALGKWGDDWEEVTK